MSLETTGRKLGDLLGRLGPYGATSWTRGQIKHVANLVARVNRLYNRNPAVKIKMTARASKTRILRRQK